MSMPTFSSDPIGNSKRVCSVVNATTVPIVIADEPDAIVSPANSVASSAVSS